MGYGPKEITDSAYLAKNQEEILKSDPSSAMHDRRCKTSRDGARVL